MVRLVPLTLSFCISLLLGATRAAEPADKPTIQQLFAGMPLISPKVEAIRQFSFSFDITADGSTLLRGHYHWQRDQPPGFYFSTDQQEAPAWFVTEKTAMLFDVVENEIVLMPNAHPYVQFGRKGNKVDFSYGIEISQREEDPFIDLAPFMNPPSKELKLTQAGSGDWVAEGISPTGKSGWKITFAADPPYAPREITAYTRQGEVRNGIRFFDIRVNQPPDNPWPRMPLQDAWPKELSLNVMPDSVKDPSPWQVRAMRILITHMAIDRETFRSAQLSGNLDWDQIRQIRDHYGPRLRHLIGFHEPVK